MKAKSLKTSISSASVTGAAAETKSPLQFLRGIFLEKKARNTAYSMRAFARDLGMSQALLSLIFSGKRPLSIKQASQIAILLQFPKEVEERFLESTLLSLPVNSKLVGRLKKSKELAGARLAQPLFTEYEAERFKAISQWYHVAILDLTTTKGFSSDPAWIARRLQIATIEVRDAIERLLLLGLLERKGKRLVKSEKTIYFATQKSELAIRTFHHQMITKALDQLQKTEPDAFSKREISALTLAIPRARIDEARKKIKKLQEEMARLFVSDECDEIYQLNMQFFPLSQSDR